MSNLDLKLSKFLLDINAFSIHIGDLKRIYQKQSGSVCKDEVVVMLGNLEIQLNDLLKEVSEEY